VDNIPKGGGKIIPEYRISNVKMSHRSYGQRSEEAISCTEAINVV